MPGPAPAEPTALVPGPVDEIPANVYARRWTILGVLCASLLLIVLANTSMNVALPTMARTLGLSNSAQQWIVDAYSLVFAGLLFTAGTLGDRFGRKGFLQAGLVLFGLGSAFATFLADSGGGIIAARAVMGVGGALVMPATLSILVNTFPAHERARAIAIWTGIAGGGGALGLVLGGWLVEHFWWGSTFAMNIPVVALALVAGAFLLPTSRDPHPSRVDVVGSLLSMGGLGLVVFGLIEAPHWGWASTSTIVTLAAGVAILAGFWRWELHTPAPMLDVRLFRNRNFSVSSLGVTLVFLVMFGFFFVVAQLFQLIFGYGPFESGLRMLAFVPVLVAVTGASPALAARFGTRNVVTTGMLLTAAGVMVLSFLDVGSSYLHVLAGMFVMAGGMGLTMTPMTDLIMSSVPRDKAGVGSAMNDTTRELGTALGVAVLGSLLSSAYASHLPASVDALSPGAADTVRSSLGGAMAVGQQIGGPAGEQLMTAAREAWTSGLQLSLTVGAGIVTLAALITYRFLGRGPAAVDAVDAGETWDDADEAELDGLAALDGAALSGSCPQGTIVG
jgi:EmrB/QacA subfamily drug resistance transporter